MVSNLHCGTRMSNYWCSRTFRIAVFAAAALVVSVQQPSAEQRPLVIRVMPLRGLAPIDLVVQGFIERNPRNRAVRFTVDSPGFYGSSTTALDGEQSPRAMEVRFRQVPAGEYRVEASLIGAMGEVAYDVLEMEVR